MEKIKELIPTNSPIPAKITMLKINEWFRGWANYFSITNYPSQILAIESHIRRRLRARIIRQSKRKRFLLKKLVAKGMKKAKAGKLIYTNIGPWKLSHKPAIDKIYSVEWFTKDIGQLIFSNRNLKHWFSVKKWVRLL